MAVCTHKMPNFSHVLINPFLPTVPTFVPLKPLRYDSALRALSSLRGLRGVKLLNYYKTSHGTSIISCLMFLVKLGGIVLTHGFAVLIYYYVILILSIHPEYIELFNLTVQS